VAGKELGLAKQRAGGGMTTRRACSKFPFITVSKDFKCYSYNQAHRIPLMNPRLFFRLAYQAATYSRNRRYVRLSLAEIDQTAQTAAEQEDIPTLLDLFEELLFRRLEPKKIWSIKVYIINRLAAIDELKLAHDTTIADLAHVRSNLITKYRTISSNDNSRPPTSLEVNDKHASRENLDSLIDKKQSRHLIESVHDESGKNLASECQDNDAISLEPCQDVDLLLQRLASGKAILFTGAGFSRGTTNIEDLEPPLTTDLALMICEAGNFPACRDLRFAADYYISTHKDKTKLISLLKRQFDIKRVNDTHISICQVNWRRFYTTNYDKSIEVAARESGKAIECIDILCSPKEYYKREGLCVHLNGSLDTLTTESLETRFKLSTSSYASADAFTASEWLFYFRKDLERSTAIVFVGYSMYDIEIQRLLHDNSTLKEKTYFVTGSNPSHDLLHTLSKYGHVLPIGIEGLARSISANASIFNNSINYNAMQSLVECELQADPIDIRDATVETFFMYGDIDDSLIDEAVSGIQRVPYLILRHQATNIFNHICKGKNIIIYSDLGNGKTTLVRILRTMLLVEGYRVFYVGDLEEDFIGDLDLLMKSSQQVVVIVDGIEPCLDVLMHLSYAQPENIHFLAAARTADFERIGPKLHALALNYIPICVDELSEEDALSFIQIVDNLGMWGSDAGKSVQQKLKILRQDHNNQLSLALLHLFKAPQIRDRLNGLLLKLLENNTYKQIIFCICVLSILDIPAEQSLIADLVGNDEIFSLDLLSNPSLKQIFRVSHNHVSSRSGLFSMFIIQTYFSPSYITKQLQGIAHKLNSYKKKNSSQDKIFKATLRFSFIERLLPGTQKRSTLLEHYENLKVSVPWLKSDPHFWLQYAMANITFKDFSKAQKFLDQAYSLAFKKQHYDTQNIDTQQARLLILKSIGEADAASAFSLFEQAHRLMIKLDENVYKYRQVPLYKDFHDAWGAKLSRKNAILFQRSCQRIFSDINLAESRSIIDHTSISQSIRAKDALGAILRQSQ
jgi:hypothetical protein